MIIKSAMVTTIIRFVMMGLGFLVSILTAHYLGPSGRGEYFFVTTLALLLTQFAQLGLSSSNTYLVAQEPILLGKLIINSVWTSLLLGFMVSGITLLLMNTLHIACPRGTWVLLLLVPASIFYLLGINLLVGFRQIALFNFIQISSNLLVCCSILFVGFFGSKTYGFLLASSLSWIISAILLLICLLRLTNVTLTKTDWFFDITCFLKGAPYGAKAYIVTLIGMLVLKSNVLLLNYFSSDETLGYYSIASQLNDCLMILPTSVAVILFPNLVRSTHHRWEETQKCMRYIICFMLVGCLLSAILVKPLIQFVFGVRFLPAVGMFWWMLPGAFFMGIITIVSQYIAAIGMPKILIFIWVLAFIVILCSSLVLIPRYAGQGAAMALSVTYFVLAVMLLGLAKNEKRSLT